MYPSYDHCDQAADASEPQYFYDDDHAVLPTYNQHLPSRSAEENHYMNGYRHNHGRMSTAAGKTNCFSTEPEQDSASWRRLTPEQWTSNDVFHWIATVSRQLNFSYEDVNASAFSIDGATLISLTREQFESRDSRFGGMLFDELHRISGDDRYTREFQTMTLIPQNEPQPGPSTIEPAPYGDSSDAYDYQPGAPRPYTQESSEDEEPPPTKKGRKPAGRPPGPKAKAKAEKKTGRLWEFIRNLLHNPEFCPSVICWEDHDEGVFRFVKSERVAKIWGKRKNNDKMNYEKLSRAMRYYYKSQVFQPVLGRKLVYKFGPNAKGWRSDNPNFRQPVKTEAT